MCTLFTAPTPPAVHIPGTIVACFLIGRVTTFSRSGLAFYAIDSVAGKALRAVSSAASACARALRKWLVVGTREKIALLFAAADSSLYVVRRCRLTSG